MSASLKICNDIPSTAQRTRMSCQCVNLVSTPPTTTIVAQMMNAVKLDKVNAETNKNYLLVFLPKAEKIDALLAPDTNRKYHIIYSYIPIDLTASIKNWVTDRHLCKEGGH